MAVQQLINTTFNLVLFVAIPLAVYVAWHRFKHGRAISESLKRAGLRAGSAKHAGICAAVALGCVALFFAWGPSIDVITREGTVQSRFAGLGLTADALLAAAVYAFVQTGFSEEFLFRGLIAGSLARRLRQRTANLLQAAIFLAPHLLLLSVMAEHWPMLILIFLGALLAGWARVVSGSILGPWLLHGGVNFGVTMYVLVYS